MNKIIDFLNLKDNAGKISISNLVVYVCLIKIILAPSFSLEEVGVLLVSMMNYAHKRHESNKFIKVKADSSEELEKRFQEVESKITALQFKNR